MYYALYEKGPKDRKFRAGMFISDSFEHADKRLMAAIKRDNEIGRRNRMYQIRSSKNQYDFKDVEREVCN